jgi:polysaccharide chain length determinant protein (PEP-CTERM system associated)
MAGMQSNEGAGAVLQQLPVFAGEAKMRRLPLVTIACAILLAALAVGVVWPKTFVASSTIVVQEDNIIQPLMEGRAAVTNTVDRARIAREVIHSRRIMVAALEEAGLLADSPTPAQLERRIEDLKGALQVRNAGENLIQLTYRDSDADRTFRVVRKVTDLFIEESLAAKERESREAYEFIAARVDEYHEKLTSAEERLKAFRAENQDARPGTATDVNTRIGELRQRIEQAQTEVSELQVRERVLQEQLSGEAESSAGESRASQVRLRLAEMQSQLETLRLSYTDDYPDVIRLRHQIDDLQAELAAAERRRAAGGGASRDAQAVVTVNPLYQQLRSELSLVRTNAAALRARAAENEALLEAELERGRRVADSEAALAELTRDYEVNRDLYQDLLRRRENARVSMSLDSERRGLSLRIQEPAALPQNPAGLRFTHFILAGLGLGLAVPLGLLVAVTKLDARVRAAPEVAAAAGVPVLVTVPRLLDARARQREARRSRLAMAVAGTTGTLFVVAVLLRLKGLL